LQYQEPKADQRLKTESDLLAASYNPQKQNFFTSEVVQASQGGLSQYDGNSAYKKSINFEAY